MTDEPLEQFREWYGALRPGWGDQSLYAKLREAFYAGYAARPQPPVEPSANALEKAARPLARYAIPRPSRIPRDAYVVQNLTPDGHPGDGSADYLPAPDYSPTGTVTGRIPRPDGPITRENFMLQAGNAPRMDHRDVDYADKAAHFVEVYGVEPAKVTRPDPATLERIHRQLKNKGVAEYPSDDTNPGLPAVTRADTALMDSIEHTETVFDGNYGARGPVPTVPGLREAENASS